MDIPAFLEQTQGSRIFLIGETHTNPRDLYTVVTILTAMIKAGRRLHIYVEYFDSRQNAEVQQFLKSPEEGLSYQPTPGPDPKASTAPEATGYLVDQKVWDTSYYPGAEGELTFKNQWMHKQELNKIKAVLMFANIHNLPLKGFDLPVLQRHLDTGPKVFETWDAQRDRWMRNHLTSFLGNHQDVRDTAVCFVGTAHCYGIAMGDRSLSGINVSTPRELGLRAWDIRCVILEPNHNKVAQAINIELKKAPDDYWFEMPAWE